MLVNIYFQKWSKVTFRLWSFLDLRMYVDEASNWLAAKTHYGSCCLPKVQHHLFKKYPTFECSPPPAPLPPPNPPKKIYIYPEWGWKECPFIYPDIIRSAVHKVLTVSTHWSNAGQVLARLVKFPTLNLHLLRSDLERKIRIYKRMKSATALDFPSEDYILIYGWTELSPWTNTVNLWLGSKLTYSVPMVGEVQFTTQEQQKPFFS